MNSKIRFQSYRFKRNLKQARDFKRPTKINLNISFSEKIFFFIKNYFKFCVLFLLILTLFFASLYWQKLFFIETIEVKNADVTTEKQIKLEIQEYFESSFFFWPRKNFFLLSKVSISEYLQSNIPNIVKINRIQKKFPKKIIFEIDQRLPVAFFEKNENFYIFSNDGIIAELFPKTPTSTIPNLLKILLPENSGELVLGQKIFSQNKVEQITEIAKNFEKKTGQAIEYIEIPNNEQYEIDPVQTIPIDRCTYWSKLLIFYPLFFSFTNFSMAFITCFT